MNLKSHPDTHFTTFLTSGFKSTQSRSTCGEGAGIVLGCAIIVLFLFSTAYSPAANSQPRAVPNEHANGPRFIKREVLVQPRVGIRSQRFEQLLRRFDATSKRQLSRLRVHVISVPEQAEQAVVRALSNRPEVEFAELNEIIEPVQIIPNDPHYSSAWHLPTINAPSAWGLNLGDNITVAILDTGVDPFHPDLGANLVAGRNTASGSSTTTDVHGHGTKVAGVVAALSDNALGVASIAWHASIMPIRVTDRSDGYASFSAIADGIVWAADRGATVANASYEVNGSSTVANAAQYMRNRGGLFFASAGNAGTDPGYSPNQSIVAVSATTSSDTKASWSNYGAYVDLSGPGTGIWTTTNGGGFGTASGTSFSSPIAAAVAALVMSANPSLSASEVELVLKNSAVDLGISGSDVEFGAGRVDAGAAVALAQNVQSGDDETPPTVQIANPTDGEEVDGMIAIDVLAEDGFGVNRVEMYVNGQLLGLDTTSPYSFAYDSSNANSGSISLEARAFDDAGNRGDSLQVSLVVNNSSDSDSEPPVVTLSQPADGSAVSRTVNIAAHATDDSGVAQVTIVVDGKMLCAGAPSVNCDWNTRKASDGSHVITAAATDTVGNRASTSVTVTVGGGSGDSDSSKGKGGGKGKKK